MGLKVALCGDIADDFLGEVRRATSRRTAEKLYKRLLKNGIPANIAKDEDLPGSRVLVGEMLLHGFVERKESVNGNTDTLQWFHKMCIHPLAQDKRLLSHATPYINSSMQSESLGSVDVDQLYLGHEDAEEPSYQMHDQRNPTSDGGYGYINIGDEAYQTSASDSNIYRSVYATTPEDGGRYLGGEYGSESTMIMSNTPEEGDAWRNRYISLMQHNSDDEIVFPRTPKGLMDCMRWTAVDISVWERQKIDDGPPTNCSVLWNSRLANIFSIVCSMDGLMDYLQCKTCADIVKTLRSSFISNLVSILRYAKKFEEMTVVYGHIFQELVQVYHNCDVIIGAYYNHVYKSVNYMVDDGVHDNKETINQMGLAMIGWLTSKRIHHFIDRLGNIRIHEIIFRVIMKLVFCKDGPFLEAEQLELFRDTFVAYMLNSAAHMIDEVCGASKIVFDPYHARGLNYCYRLNLRLHVLNCMMEQYIRVVASITTMVDESGIVLFHTVAAPFLANERLYRWLQTVKFKGWSGEEQLMQNRLGVVVLYVLALNHQQPFLRSEDIKFLRKFHGLPWASAFAFCAEDYVSNHMLAPLTIALVQCLGEGILLNLDMGETAITVLDDANSHITQENLDIYGIKDTKLSLMEPVERTSVYAMLRILWPKIMAKVLSHNVRRMSLCPMIYYSITHLMPILWTHDVQYGMVDVYDENKQKEDTSKRNIHINWVVHLINNFYCMEPTMCDLAMVDAIVFHFMLAKGPRPVSRVKDYLMLFNYDPRFIETQDQIASNYIALHQNPVNILLRMPQKETLNSFTLRLFSNVILQLLYSLYKDVCYAFPSFNMQRRTQLGITYINALQEAAILNVVMELAENLIPRHIEINLVGFISMLTTKTTFTDEVISVTGLPLTPILSAIEVGIPEDMLFDRLTENFKVSVEPLLKPGETAKKRPIESASFNKQNRHYKMSLKSYSAADVATYHLYNVLLQVLDMPELSKVSSEVKEEPNAQRFINVIQLYWRCFQRASINAACFEFIKNSISIVLKLHYLCPWMVTSSMEQLQTWIHAEKNIVPELQEFTVTVVTNLGEIYQEINEMDKVE